MAENNNLSVTPMLESIVMTEVALQEGQFGVSALASHLEMPTGTVSRATRLLKQKRWMEGRPADTHPAGGGWAVQLLFSTPAFQEAVGLATQQVGHLSFKDRALFEEAVEAYESAEGLAEGVTGTRLNLARFSTASELSRRHNLCLMTEGVWFPGRVGWQSLIALSAHGVASDRSS